MIYDKILELLQKKNDDEAKILCKKVKRRLKNDQKVDVIKSAVRFDCVMTLDYMIDTIHDGFDNMDCAAEYDSVKIMEYYSEHIGLGYGNNSAIQIACAYGSVNMVKFLLSSDEVDPTVDDNIPLMLACKNNHVEIVELLLAD